MSIQPGTYELGPQSGRLTIRTSRQGAAQRAGHDLVIEVQSWGATVQVASDPAQSLLELTADSSSLKVLEGTGGLKALSDKDRGDIVKTINKEVLRGGPIAFRSTAVRPDGESRWHVTGDLEINGASNLVAFDLDLNDDGRVSGGAVVTQSQWGMKPYTALFGALKVADEVRVEVDGQMQSR